MFRNSAKRREKMTYQHYPTPTVGTLVFNPKGEVLLVKSHKWRDKYVIPGGHIELGENMEEALKREIKEETGLDIYDIEFICFFEFIYGDGFYKKRHFIFFDFAAKTDSMDVKLNEEHQDYIWITLNKISDYPVEKYTLKAIEKYKVMQE
jgi:nucleoside triphosphatase